jgi:phospholipid/cholesterol/gamma-HCH transport system permease protein
MSAAHLEVTVRDGGQHVRLAGRWTLATTSLRAADLAVELGRVAAADARWDCKSLEAIDSAGAMLLWRAWGRAMPAQLEIKPEHWRVFERIQTADHEPRPAVVPVSPLHGVIVVGGATIGVGRHLADFVALIGQFGLNLVHVLRFPADLPKREISANLYKSGVRAMPVTALVGFLIGVVLSYLSALQLKQFGADIFIVNIIGLGIVRELGPVLVAILVAGRSGSAMTAQLGVMRVTEEIDALATMGVPRGLRLIFPKVVALTIAMPLLCCGPRRSPWSAAWFRRRCSSTFPTASSSRPCRAWCPPPTSGSAWPRVRYSACSSRWWPAISASGASQYREPVEPTPRRRWSRRSPW